ncbi:MAG: hypothetical protein NTX90_13375 [Alphaproteobacteria bacterium]|nr:hypothetical protein [Alphaproteobacteria bacterium]
MFSANFIDIAGRIDPVENGASLYAGITTHQDIPDSFLQRLRDTEDNKRPGAEYSLAASIPVIFVEKWLREGFDIYREPLKAIEARCRREGLEKFLVK